MGGLTKYEKSSSMDGLAKFEKSDVTNLLRTSCRAWTQVTKTPYNYTLTKVAIIF